MDDFKHFPVERSDDLRRGTLPHLARTVAQVRGLQNQSTRCADCRATPATHLVDTQHQPRAVCATCAAGWRRATVSQREERRAAFARRGLQ